MKIYEFDNKITEMRKTNLKDAYTAFELNEKDRNYLLSLFPPKYPDVIAHHITYQFGVPPDSDLPEQPKDIQVVGYADDGESIEALVVEIDSKIKRPDGKIYHITWSLDRSKGRKPVHSNDLILKHGYKKTRPIQIKATPKRF